MDDPFRRNGSTGIELFYNGGGGSTIVVRVRGTRSCLFRVGWSLLATRSIKYIGGDGFSRLTGCSNRSR